MCLRFQFCTHQRVCILHFLKKSQIRCTLLHWGTWFLGVIFRICDCTKNSVRLMSVIVMHDFRECIRMVYTHNTVNSTWRNGEGTVSTVYCICTKCTIVFWCYKEWKRGRIKYMWKSRSREKRRLYEKTTLRPAPETRHIYENS